MHILVHMCKIRSFYCGQEDFTSDNIDASNTNDENKRLIIHDYRDSLAFMSNEPTMGSITVLKITKVQMQLSQLAIHLNSLVLRQL